jgi:hypothetical protein
MTAKLFVFSVVLNLLSHFGWTARPWTNVAEGLTDVGVAWFLAYCALRPAQDDVLSPALRRRLAMVTA